MNTILKNKNCLVTGATGGIGKEISKELASNSCNLFLTSTNNTKLIKLKNIFCFFSVLSFCHFVRSWQIDKINKKLHKRNNASFVNELRPCGFH